MLFLTLTIISSLLSHSIGFPAADFAINATSKAGIAGGSSQPQFAATGKVSWYYTWSPGAIPNTGANLEFVPMLWGSKDIAAWTQSINDTIAKNNVKAILGMNEPELAGQSNINAQQGAELWKTYIEPLHAQGLRLGSPAPSSSPTGLTWLQDFLTACNGGCTVDFIALHWYDVNATAFIDYLENFHNIFQRPLWVTEWACQNFNNVNQQCSKNDIVLFMNKTQSYMDSADFVERYAWFGVPNVINPDDALYDPNGKLTQLGEQYTGAVAPKVNGTGSADGPPSGGSGGVKINVAIPSILSMSKWSIIQLLCLSCLMTTMI